MPKYDDGGKQVVCPECDGTGMDDDADPGDIYFQDFACEYCQGEGWVDE